MKRKILLNPGPTTTSKSVKRALMSEDICHREKDFVAVIDKLRKDLVKIVHGNLEEDVCVLFSGSGTINMDVTLNSLLEKDKKILVLNNGAYSTRAVEICQYYNLDHYELKFPFDEKIDVSKVLDFLSKHDDVSLVYTTHHETGSGVLNDVKAIGQVVHQFNAQFVIDATSSYALVPLNIQEDEIDFLFASAQKGLAAMPGLSFIIGKRHLIEKAKDYPKRSYYTNLYRQYYNFEYGNKEMHFTPPIQLIYALSQGIKEYFLEGEVNKCERLKRMCEFTLFSLKELGFKLYLKEEHLGPLVIAVLYPDDPNWSFQKIHDYLYKKGVILFPRPVGEVRAFRIGLLGNINELDLKLFFKLLKKALITYNIKVPVYYEKKEGSFL